MGRIQDIAAGIQGGTPTAEQQAEMAAVVEGSGLTIDRFNAISTAVSQDQALQARMLLADAERAAAAEQGRVQRERFLTPGSGYQPGNAQMFNTGNH